jgi:hypothetical protein
MTQNVGQDLDKSKHLYQIDTHINEDGSLGVIDFADTRLPFAPKRLFYIFGVDEGAIRGKHAHKNCKQFFIQLSGSSMITYINKSGKGVYVLNSPSEGFLAEELTWCEISDFSEGSVLMVLASDPYDADDYIHDISFFEAQIGSSN